MYVDLASDTVLSRVCAGFVVQHGIEVEVHVVGFCCFGKLLDIVDISVLGADCAFLVELTLVRLVSLGLRWV